VQFVYLNGFMLFHIMYSLGSRDRLCICSVGPESDHWCQRWFILSRSSASVRYDCLVFVPAKIPTEWWLSFTVSWKLLMLP